MIELAGQKPLFEGGTRSVFRYPYDDSYVIKLPLQAWIDKINEKSALKRLWKGLSPTSINCTEYFEYQKIKKDEDRDHLPIVGGLIETDLGLGLVEKVEYGDGNEFARSLESYGENVAQFGHLIEDFIQWVCRTDLIIYDLYLCNEVISWRNGKPRCVMIDGFGETGLIPRRHLFKRRNRRKNIKQIEFFIEQLEELCDYKVKTALPN